MARRHFLGAVYTGLSCWVDTRSSGVDGTGPPCLWELDRLVSVAVDHLLEVTLHNLVGDVLGQSWRVDRLLSVAATGLSCPGGTRPSSRGPAGSSCPDGMDLLARMVWTFLLGLQWAIFSERPWVIIVRVVPSGWLSTRPSCLGGNGQSCRNGTGSFHEGDTGHFVAVALGHPLAAEMDHLFRLVLDHFVGVTIIFLD